MLNDRRGVGPLPPHPHGPIQGRAGGSILGAVHTRQLAAGLICTGRHATGRSAADTGRLMEPLLALLPVRGDPHALRVDAGHSQHMLAQPRHGAVLAGSPDETPARRHFQRLNRVIQGINPLQIQCP